MTGSPVRRDDTRPAEDGTARAGRWPGDETGDRDAPEDERRARAALNAITEPGDPRVARLMGALGAIELRDRLAEDTDLTGLRSETAERLAGVDVGRLLGEAAERGIRFLVPGDTEWPAGLEELRSVEELNGM